MLLARRIPIVLALIAGGFALLAGALSVQAAPQKEVRTFPGFEAPCNTTLQACIDGSAAGDQINILHGIYITSVTLNKPVSLYGAGSTGTTLRALSGQRVLTVTSAVTAETIISSLTLYGGVLAAGNGGAVWVQAGAQPTLIDLNVRNGSVTAPGALGGGLYTEASLELHTVTFLNNTAPAGHGGGLAGSSDAHLTLRYVDFDGNSAANGGGGLWANSASIENSLFMLNATSGPTGSGGGAYVTSTVAMTNSLFTMNTASDSGGAVYSAGSLVADNSRFTGNLSFDSGGALFSGGPVTLTYSLLSYNHSTNGAGGGLRGSSTAFIDNTEFLFNQAYNQGGGLRATGDLFVTDSTFNLNVSGVGGPFPGGGGLDAIANATLIGGSFAQNGTSSTGGGARVLGTATVSGTVFSSNGAGVGGGGLQAVNATVQNATFDQNQVLVGNGGGLGVTNTLVLSDSLFTRNAVISGTQAAATGSGGGVYGDGVITSTGNLFIGNGAHRLGGGMDADDLLSTGDVFRGNLTGPQGSGGGVFVAGDFTIDSGQFYTNTANTAGGLGINSSAAGTVANSLFARNTISFTDGGAALRILATSPVTLTHNTLVGTNALAQAAIIKTNPSSVALLANLIADHARGIQQGGQAPTSTVTTAHTLFSNVGLPYVGLPGGILPASTDFTATVTFVDAAGFDYHLTPGSLGVDAAPDYGLADDFEGDPRPQGAGFDIGFDEAAALYRVYLPAVLRQP